MAEKEKAQLHQLLAVEADRKQKAGIILNETANVFGKKGEFFDGLVKTYSSFEEDGDKMPAEIREIVTSVPDKLKYTMKAVITALDAQLSKEETNSSGTVRAELKVGEIDFGEISAPGLLALESHLNRVRVLYHAIPTLDLTRAWHPDVEKGGNYWKTDPELRYRNTKASKPITLSTATKEHPAQVQLVTTDKQVGEWTTVYKSGKITSAQKSILLSNKEFLTFSLRIC